MILHTKDRLVGQTQTFDRVIVEVAMSDKHISGQRLLVNRIVVILCCDLDIGRIDIAYWLVATVMTKLKLIGFRV